MTSEVRAILHNSETDKTRELRSETVRRRDEKGECLGTATPARKTLLGAARGKITIRGDLTRPTLATRDRASF